MSQPEDLAGAPGGSDTGGHLTDPAPNTVATGADADRWRKPVVIEGTAWEEPPPGYVPPPSAADEARAEAATARVAGKPSFMARHAGLTAAVLIGVGGGALGAYALNNEVAERKDLALANARLAERLAVLERAQAPTEIKSALAAAGDVQSSIAAARIAAETSAGQLASHLADTQRQNVARFEKIEKVLAERDATASINALPAPPAPPAPAIASKDKPGAPPPAFPLPTAPAGKPAAKRSSPGGWVLREVHDGIALLESQRGWRQVLPGDFLAGAGRVVRVERRGGQWIVVTSGGVIENDLY